jgi:hypothetical protein
MRVYYRPGVHTIVNAARMSASHECVRHVGSITYILFSLVLR